MCGNDEIRAQDRERLLRHAEMIQQFFENRIPDRPENGELIRSMRYSLLAPGKRIRPHLTFEFCRLFGGSEEEAIAYAAAVEALHTYSLIHDDLPCMDNDDLRRGRPTNHKVYGEAMAMLAGDALQTFAFRLAAGNERLSAEQNAKAVVLLAEKAGETGICGGQEEDLENENKSIQAKDLDRINEKKTGALLEAACGLGCIAAGADEKQMEAAMLYARCFGAAFQIVDDILDVTASEEQFGKNVKSDRRNQKTTYASLLGLESAYTIAKQLTERAAKALEGYPGSAYLMRFAKSSLERKK